MGLQARKKEDATWYIVNFAGNRDDEEDPFAVHISPMNEPDMRKAQGGLGRVAGGNWNPIERAQLVRDRVIKERVLEVRGFLDVDGNAVSTGAQLLKACTDSRADASMDAVLEDIYQAITDVSRLSEGVRKNSHSRSALP